MSLIFRALWQETGLQLKYSPRELNKPDSVIPAHRDWCLSLWARTRALAQAAYPEAVWAHHCFPIWHCTG